MSLFLKTTWWNGVLCHPAIFSLVVLLGVPSSWARQSDSLSATPRFSKQFERDPVERKTAEAAGDSGVNERKKYKFDKTGAIVYHRGDDFRLTLDVYQPKGEGPFPAVLAVHGGAWRSGSKITMLRHAWKLAAAGYVVVAVNYRHAPAHKFPAQIHDMKHAVRWMRYHCEKYQIDPERIAAFGYSAGGHLVSLLGVTDKNDGLEGPVKDELKGISTRVQAVVAGGAPCEFSWVKPNSRLLAYWLGGTPQELPEIFQQATALNYSTSDDPPFYFFHGDADMVVGLDSSTQMHESLIKAGVHSEHHLAKGRGHLATFSDTDWMDRVIEFLQKHMPAKNSDNDLDQGVEIEQQLQNRPTGPRESAGKNP